MASSVKCPLCGASEITLLFDFPEFTSKLNIPGTIYECAACTMQFKVPVTEVKFSEVYGPEYHAEVALLEYNAGLRTQRHFKKLIERVRRAAPKHDATLLDIGSAEGSLVSEALAAGFAAEGIDLCEAHVSAAKKKGLPISFGDVLTLPVNRQYDVITLTDLIEHVFDPAEVIRKVRALLKPEGVVLVATPNHDAVIVHFARLVHRLGVSGPARNIFGSNHLRFFTVKTLQKLMKDSGFEAVDVWLEKYDVLRPGGKVPVTALILISALEMIGKMCGQTFRHYYIGRNNPAAVSLLT